MAIQNNLIMNLLRIITPEEIGQVASQHNGGKYLSLMDLVKERVVNNIYRDFSRVESMEEIHEAHGQEKQAKILPFEKVQPMAGVGQEIDEQVFSLSDALKEDKKPILASEKTEHNVDENMSSFILIEKARLKRAQHVLKKKEIIDLYKQNCRVEVEQIKGTNENLESSSAGVLVNKKQY